jgi:phage terminase large subunit GpA-like protein
MRFKTSLKKIREEIFKPPQYVSLVEWPEKYRRVTGNSEFLGNWSNDNQPLAIKPMQLIQDPYITHVYVKYPAQVCKTAILTNFAGYLISEEPQNFIVVHPNSALSRDFSKKIDDMIDDTPRLADMMRGRPRREALDNMQEKRVNGMELIMIAAGNAQNLAGRTAPNVAIDEVDELQDDKTQGDKTKVVENRTNSFRRKNILYTSTPRGTKETSKIHNLVLNSLRYELQVECPDCGHAQLLGWDNVTWKGKGSDGDDEPSTAAYACSGCGSLWDDWQRKQSLTKAFRSDNWVVVNPDYKNKKKVSVTATQLHNIHSSLADLVYEFLEAKEAGPAQLVAFFNTKMATVFDPDVIHADNWQRCMQRRERYGAELIPNDIALITTGADVQGDRIEVTVLGHYRDEKWVIEKHIIPYSPYEPKSWSEYLATTNKVYTKEDGSKIQAVIKAIDSRYASQQVHEFTMKNVARGHIAIKGIAGDSKQWIDRTKKLAHGNKFFYNVGQKLIKDWVFYTMSIHECKEKGKRFIHLPATFVQDDLQQIFSETYNVQRGRYEQTRKRNEGLDCLVYALAAEKFLKTNWDAYDERLKNEHRKDRNNSEQP